MHTPQVITSGVDYIFLIVPVVLVLFGWIGACFWANAHPEVRHVGRAPAQAIARGEAQAEAEATPAAGAADENQPADERIAAAEAQPEQPEQSEQSGQRGQRGQF